MQRFITNQRNFVSNTLVYRQPMKRVEQWGDMGGSVNLKDQSSSIVLDLLKFVKQVLGTAS